MSAPDTQHGTSPIKLRSVSLHRLPRIYRSSASRYTRRVRSALLVGVPVGIIAYIIIAVRNQYDILPFRDFFYWLHDHIFLPIKGLLYTHNFPNPLVWWNFVFALVVVWLLLTALDFQLVKLLHVAALQSAVQDARLHGGLLWAARFLRRTLRRQPDLLRQVTRHALQRALLELSAEAVRARSTSDPDEGADTLALGQRVLDLLRLQVALEDFYFTARTPATDPALLNVLIQCEEAYVLLHLHADDTTWGQIVPQVLDVLDGVLQWAPFYNVGSPEVTPEHAYNGETGFELPDLLADLRDLRTLATHRLYTRQEYTTEIGREATESAPQDVQTRDKAPYAFDVLRNLTRHTTRRRQTLEQAAHTLQRQVSANSFARGGYEGTREPPALPPYDHATLFALGHLSTLVALHTARFSGETLMVRAYMQSWQALLLLLDMLPPPLSPTTAAYVSLSEAPVPPRPRTARLTALLSQRLPQGSAPQRYVARFDAWLANRRVSREGYPYLPTADIYDYLTTAYAKPFHQKLTDWRYQAQTVGVEREVLVDAAVMRTAQHLTVESWHRAAGSIGDPAELPDDEDETE